MSNLKHVSVGVKLSQVEFEGENLHYVEGGTPGNMLILTAGGFLVEAVGNIAAWNDHIIADGKQHADVVTNTTHRGLSDNPHSTNVENLGAGTIAELNSCLSDGSLAEATDITEIRKLTQSTYNGLTPNASTLYFIVG